MEDKVYHRAEGSMICDNCGLTYREHPYSTNTISRELGEALTILCDLTLVKI